MSKTVSMTHVFSAVFPRVAAACCLIVTVSLPSMTAQAREMYRYTNADGVKVIAYQVPPEFVAGGYEVLSPTGALVSVVPRTLRDGERDDMDAFEQIQHEALKEQERLRKWDESLLLKYSTIDDIEAARERALRELRIRVGILNGKLRSLTQQIESYQSTAANMERIGSSVGDDHIAAINELRSEIDATERALADRREEIAVVDENYDRDVERFTTLLDIVELRKDMSIGRRSDS